MKRILSGLLAAFIASAAFAADVKISAEPAMSALAGTEIFLGNQSGVTKTATAAQISTYVSGNLSSIALASLATQATNTVVGNATSGSAAPTALAVGTCSTTASALIWTTNTGFGCNTTINAGTLGGATFASPGTIGGGTAGIGSFAALNASGLFSPSLGITATGAVVNLNASSNFVTNIGTGTTTSAVNIGNTAATGSALTISAPTTLSTGTSISKASWTTGGVGLIVSAATYNDTTAGSGGVATEAAYAFGAPTTTNTQGTSNVLTNNINVYFAAPICGAGWASCTTNFGIFSAGKIGGTAGATLNGNTITLNNSSNFSTSINTGTNNTTLTLGGTTAGNTVNLASVSNQVGAVLYSSVTAPTINSHFNTSGDSIVAASTAAFQVTVGSGAGTTTGSLTMPAAITGWSCEATDVTTPASHAIQQTGSSTTGVTVTDYIRTTGIAQNFANGDKINFICGAF